MIRACLCLLVGVYALQLNSFALDSDLIVLTCLTFLAALRIGKVRELLVVAAGSTLFFVATTDVVNSRMAHEFVGDSIVAQVRIVDFPKLN